FLSKLRQGEKDNLAYATVVYGHQFELIGVCVAENSLQVAGVSRNILPAGRQCDEIVTFLLWPSPGISPICRRVSGRRVMLVRVV
ncbi:MAG: hypothetical protein WC003_16650, partial [Terrimicrobiaceae bacterium]